MTKRNRAYRRYKTWLKFKKRVDIWVDKSSGFVVVEEDQRQDIYDGKSHLLLRTQGRPCNCSMCTPNKDWDKFKRPQKQYVLKDAYEDIETAQ